MIEALASYPAWVHERIGHPTEGLSARCRFLPTVADIVEMAVPLVQAMEDREERRTQTAYRASLRPMSMGEYDQARKDDPAVLERRKAAVQRELGYDPGKTMGSRRKWCFDPEKPPVNAPWHDPKALRESMDRLMKFKGMDERR